VSRAVRVLVADDSPTMRAILQALLTEEGDVDVVGHARDGVEAVRLARSLLPDLVTMDVRMPGLGGLEATAAIMAEAPCRILVVCAVDEEEAVRLGFEAVSAGALELLPKPRVGEGAGLDVWGRRLREAVKLMAEIPVVGRRRRGSYHDVEHTELSVRAAAVGLVASTGGPPALAHVLGRLPGDLPAPVFVVQHMAPGFARGLVRWLSESTKLRVVAVQRAMRIETACAYLPIDGHDLVIQKHGIVDVAPGSENNCPSGDRLLGSLARAFGSQSLGVVLTGMGDDGVEGLRAIRAAGGFTLAQDAATSVVYGMASAAHRAGVVSRLLPLQAIAPTVLDLVRGRAAPASTIA
jgi:two-component system, chemotaxis family, protein-glutamate methylesterase/glutaminase